VVRQIRKLNVTDIRCENEICMYTDD